MLPLILDRFDWCIKNYGKRFWEDQLAHVNELVAKFLEQIPVGGSNDKAIKHKIAEIKAELRSVSKWDQLFYRYKAASFASEIEYIFALEGNPIACIWHYSRLDEQGEYQKTYNHKQRDGHVCAVRNNWAIRKGLMRTGPDGYIDQISRPHQEAGCMCRPQWVYGVGALPIEMLTEKGKSERSLVVAAMEDKN